MSERSDGITELFEQKCDKIKRQIRYHLNEHQKLDQNALRDNARLQRTQQSIETLNHAFDRIDTFYQYCGEHRYLKETCFLV